MNNESKSMSGILFELFGFSFNHFCYSDMTRSLDLYLRKKKKLTSKILNSGYLQDI